MKTQWMVWGLLCVAWQAQAQPLVVEPGEQQALEQQRAELMAKKRGVLDAHAQIRQQCWQRFAVNDCLRDVRRAQRKELAPIETALIELNARERSLRLIEREQRLQDKAKP